MNLLKTAVISVLIAVIFLPFTVSAQFNGTGYDIRKSVVKILVTEQAYNYRQPWQKLSIQKASGSGFIIEGNRIMTNAHVVEDAKYLQVKKFGDPKLYTAKVDIVGSDCDLAVIKVIDNEFFSDTKPLPIGKLPHVMDEVVVLGYPIGGDELNITQGIVSRVEHITYTNSYYYFLGCQIDATINPGNSGGPVLHNGVVVGVAFQGRSSDDLSYMIPPPIINHFLRDIEDEEYDGFSDLLIKFQTMINEDLRKFYKMPEDVSGILVYDVQPESPVKDKLKYGDIITAIDDVNIADDGSVEFRTGERTTWGYLTDNKFVGEEIKIDIYRKGKPMTIRAVMKKISDARLVPYIKANKEPKFFVKGGLVLQPLTVNYLITMRYPPQKYEYEWQYGEIEEDRKEVVIISEILPHDLNKGYDNLIYDFIVNKVNGKKIAELKDLIDILENTDEEFIIIEEKDGEKIIFKTETLREKNDEILRQYNVVKDRSDCYRE